MITLLLSHILPARVLRWIEIVAETIDETQTMRREMHKKYRLGFDS